MSVNQVTWFEIGTDRPEVAERFYGELFGWGFSDDAEQSMPYRLITAPGAGAPAGGVFGTKGEVPNYAVFVVQVADVAATCAAAEAAGGKVLVPPQQGDGALVFAHLHDPSGNHFGVFSDGTS
ncbi:VOC family protein [Spirilliplanes yamanashiensis]|uniref:Glyoxalase n=1 Tax=Spirilliplanes yamanashiensis TaxID=42233 RepID=A0A8J4DLS5_9ACTN|nr:VOC family protein [Spirilliplanes yamanashiensis]MDP9816743.1 putative enzyme related to lactoylglutathione lyase [Spirilliplanes yamanashiensis]GIJ06266.1 glyoxalase [Spirilliplanes yamanashiensis]